MINKYLTKVAVRLHLYEDDDGKKKWIEGSGKVPEGYHYLRSIYKRRKLVSKFKR